MRHGTGASLGAPPGELSGESSVVRTGCWSRWANAGLFAVVYFLAAELGRALTPAQVPLTSYWPPSGLMLGVLVLARRRDWPALLTAAYLANLAFDLHQHYPLGPALAWALCTPLEGLAAAALLCRRATARFNLESLHGVVGLVLVGLVFAPILAAVLGGVVAAVAGYGPPGRQCLLWWLGDILGVLTCAPLALVALDWRPRRPSWRRLARVAEALLALLVVGVLAWVVFALLPEQDDFLVLAALAWLALRFGVRGVAVGGAILCAVGLRALSLQLGAADPPVDPVEALLPVQAFLITVHGMVLCLAAVLGERRRTAARYRLITDSMVDTVWITDLRLRLLFAAPSLLRAWGPKGRSGPPTTLAEHLAPGSAELARQTLRDLLEPGGRRNGAGRTVELEFVRGDGSSYLSENLVSLVRNADGAPVELLGVGRDITERKRAEEERLRLEARLRQASKMEAIGQLAGGVAHDFNNLLTTIVGYADFLDQALASGDALREDVGEIRRAAERAASLTSQLLAFSRRQVTRPQVLDLSDAVRGVERMLRPMLGEDVELVVETAAEPVTARLDPTHLEQVIINLAVNARDAMPAGGRLTLATSPGTLQPEGGGPTVPAAVLRVADDGGGMDEATRARIYEPFFTTKPVGQGTGLGLATVYGIVQQHDGRIDCASEPGRGTEFTIAWPQAVEPVARAEPDTAPAAAGGRETILLVEDEAAVRALAVRVLRAQGYTVLTAANGEEALAMAAAHDGPLDLLLTDVVMPGLDGHAVAEQLAVARPGLRVLYVSGYNETVIAGRGVVAEGVDLLSKPFAPGELARRVRAALDQ